MVEELLEGGKKWDGGEWDGRRL